MNNTTPCTITVTVQDKGEPGSQGPNRDKFSITVVASPAEMVTLRDLRRGNIQIHQSQFESESLVASAAEGIFPSGASLNGVQLSGLQVGKGIITSGTGTARGDFQTLLLGTSMLGQPQNINVEGSASSGSRNADGSVTFAGVSTVDMGDGTVPLSVVPFSVTVTPQALALTLGLSALPSATVTAGRITIE